MVSHDLMKRKVAYTTFNYDESYNQFKSVNYNQVGSGQGKTSLTNNKTYSERNGGFVKFLPKHFKSFDTEKNYNDERRYWTLKYLINNNIISLSFIPCSITSEDQNVSSSTELVPNWVKNNAKWWSEDLIGNTDFINGLDYLIEEQIIKIDNKKILGKVPLEDIKFSDLLILDKNNLVFIRSAFFEIYGETGSCIPDDGRLKWNSILLALNPLRMEQYNEVAAVSYTHLTLPTNREV